MRTIDRYLSRCGVASRTGARRLVLEGRVRVNGEVISNAEQWIDPEVDRVTLDGNRVVTRCDSRLLIYNKPRGVITTVRDPEGRPCLGDQLPEEFRTDPSLRAVGRLDRASAGLLLLTDDNDLSDQILSPERHVEKEYRAKFRPCPSEDQIEQLRAGVDIGDKSRTAPARVELEKISRRSGVIRIIISEGRNRQVRRMAKSLGSEVEWLVRVRIGAIELGSLTSGEARWATDRELSAMRGEA
ncbi:MAG TPA: rRNA pseudouridine synthase [Planctomycetes bacterium]|nr:rRNA pseudouridine synthase [Planctomycetota bacterium]HIN81046.1 rRNA pseudouridine synthase [Planctomycetota bacterium]